MQFTAAWTSDEAVSLLAASFSSASGKSKDFTNYGPSSSVLLAALLASAVLFCFALAAAAKAAYFFGSYFVTLK